MARKRERHMPLGRRLAGQCFVTIGAVLLMVLTLLWSQYLFPTILDSHVAFNVQLVTRILSASFEALRQSLTNMTSSPMIGLSRTLSITPSMPSENALTI